MKVIKTDSLGIEILNSISLDETKKELVLFNNKEKVLQNLDVTKIILFEVLENNKVTKYFVIEEDIYNKWVNEYKIEGVEL